jgi:adenylyltransferase/sulfurtransferase
MTPVRSNPMSVALSAQERERYDRQILIGEIGVAGQQKLKAAKALICGVGGLGSPAALYLAAAGVGTITLIDRDQVTLSNLNRQVLHHEKDIGRDKITSAKEKLGQMNTSVHLQTHQVTLTETSAHSLIAGHDVIIDALDNMDTRYVVNKAAVDLGVPLIHGAVSGFEGRILTIIPGQSTCLRCLSRGAVEPQEKIPVVGVTPAVIGALQATEAVKVITEIGDLLINRLLRYDGLTLKWQELKVHRNPHCSHCRHL